jgi:hypothetical protein
MIGDSVKILHKSWRVGEGEVKGYKAHLDAKNEPARDGRGFLLGMITPRLFKPGTVGVVTTEVEKVCPAGIEAVGINIRFAEEDKGEVWYFPLENVQLR